MWLITFLTISIDWKDYVRKFLLFLLYIILIIILIIFELLKRL